MAKLRVGIIGAGLIGNKRAEVIKQLKQDEVGGVFDIDAKRAKELAGKHGVKTYNSWQALLADSSINSVVVATTTDVNAKITLAALKAGKNVLAEKPLGKNFTESKLLAQTAARANRVLKVGFNHRLHPALAKAHQLAEAGRIGKLFYIRCVYGHGARPGYDLSWRMQKKFSPGGELLDQGVHVLDLAYWFLGKFALVHAAAKNYFWKKSNLEDNAFCQMQTKAGQIADFHVSLTQWKNRFTFEIFGEKGYIIAEGLGRSYGTETLTLGTEVGLGKVPKQRTWQFPGPDVSWTAEWKEFRAAVLSGKKHCYAEDNAEVMKLLENLYASAKSGKIITLK